MNQLQLPELVRDFSASILIGSEDLTKALSEVLHISFMFPAHEVVSKTEPVEMVKPITTMDLCGIAVPIMDEKVSLIPYSAGIDPLHYPMQLRDCLRLMSGLILRDMHVESAFDHALARAILRAYEVDEHLRTHTGTAAFLMKNLERLKGHIKGMPRKKFYYAASSAKMVSYTIESVSKLVLALDEAFKSFDLNMLEALTPNNAEKASYAAVCKFREAIGLPRHTTVEEFMRKLVTLNYLFEANNG